MTALALSSRAIIGEYYLRLSALDGMGWITAFSNLFQSDQGSETYNWLGQSPVMREWIGGRNAKGFTTNGLTITNKQFEATLEVLIKDIRRDKTGQVMMRIADLAARTNSHWAKLLSILIDAGESTVCYDGQYFFDTDHEEGDSGSQSNDIDVDISGLPVTNHGNTTAPSVAEMQQVIMRGVQAIYGFKDNVGEPLNETAADFAVMVPTPLFNIANSAVSSPVVDGGDTNPIVSNSNLNLSVVTNPRLTWTDKVSVWRTDGAIKPLIRQEETGVELKAKAEGSEFEYDNNAWSFGVDANRNVGFGMWQSACLLTMT